MQNPPLRKYIAIYLKEWMALDLLPALAWRMHRIHAIPVSSRLKLDRAWGICFCFCLFYFLLGENYFGHLTRRADSLEKTLMLGEIEGRGRRGWQRTRWLDGHEFEQALGDGEGHKSLTCYSPWHCKESDRTEWLNNNKLSEAKGLEEGEMHNRNYLYGNGQKLNFW